MPETAYATCGDLSLAYQVFGEGPIDLVFAGSFVSHVEMFWAMPEFEGFMARLSTFCRVLLFDKAGVGLSDPVPKVRTLDDRAAELEAVMDAAGFGKAVLFGVSEGGPAAMLFAATRPERTQALVLTGASAFAGWGSWDDMEDDAAALRERMAPKLGAVSDLVIGSGIGFEERGSVELRGVPGVWQLLAVDRHGVRTASREVQLAAEPTPGPQTAMRRSDRAVALMAKRTPWILRGMARLAPATTPGGTATHG